MEILINIFKDLTEEEKCQIKKSFSLVGKVKLDSYYKKSSEASEIIQFIFEDFNIFSLARDGQSS